jgi:hypothetical protein
MIFTSSDVSSLARSLERWEWAEYASCALVALGCTGEYIAEFTVCWTGGIKERKDRLAKRSTLLLISALALELMCLVKTNSISGMLIGSLSEKASAAETKSQSALAKAGIAENKADEAFDKSNLAKDAADKAQRKADAVGKQADKLNRKLLTATTQLAAVDAKRAELEKSLMDFAVCTAPRVIPLWSMGSGLPINTKSAVDPLKQFAGEEVVIEYLPFDAETRRAASNIAAAIVNAGWKIDKVTAVDGIPDGVEIQHFVHPPNDYSLLGADWHSIDVADALVAFLHSYNWEATSRWPVDAQGILIRDPKIIPIGG